MYIDVTLTDNKDYIALAGKILLLKMYILNASENKKRRIVYVCKCISFMYICNNIFQATKLYRAHIRYSGKYNASSRLFLGSCMVETRVSASKMHVLERRKNTRQNQPTDRVHKPHPWVIFNIKQECSTL